MERDPSVVLIGEDVGAAGGVFKLTEGLFDKFGPERVVDTPISEQAIVGAAMGAAMTGLRPVAELMFSDFFAVTWDMVANQIAKTRYMTDGQVSIPLVLRTANGAGLRFGAQHSQSDRELGDGDPGPQGRRAVDAGRRRRADGRRDPRPRPGDLLRAQGACSRPRARSPTASTSCRSARRRSSARASDVHDRRDRGDGPAGRSRPPDRLADDHGISAEVIDLRTLVPLDVADDPRLGREDEPAVHRRGEPAALRLGRRDRLDRRRRGLLQPRRADRPDHDAAHPAAVGGGARGRGAADRRPDRRDRPDAGWRTARMTDRRARRDRADGLGDGARPARAGLDVVLYNRTPRAGRRRWRSSSAATCAPRPPTVAAQADVVADDARRRRRGRCGLPGGPTGLLAGARPGTVLVDLSTVTPDTIRSLEARCPRDRRRHPRFAGVRQRHARPQSGQLTLMVGGNGRGPRAGPAGPRAAGEDDRPRRRRSASGAAMKLAVNTVIFGLNEAARGGPRPGRGRRRRPRDGLRRHRRERRRGAVRRLQAGGVRRAGDDAGRLLARPRRQGPPADPRARGPRRARRCRRRETNLDAIADGGRGARRRRDFSAVATHLRNERKGATPHAAGGP